MEYKMRHKDICRWFLLSQGSRFWTNLLGSCRWPQNAEGTPFLNALQRIPEPPSSRASHVGVAPGEEEHQPNSGHKQVNYASQRHSLIFLKVSVKCILMYWLYEYYLNQWSIIIILKFSLHDIEEINVVFLFF